MGACRESKNIWFRIKLCLISSYSFPDLFKWRWWWNIFSSEYFWQDSFVYYYNKWVICQLNPHDYYIDEHDHESDTIGYYHPGYCKKCGKETKAYHQYK